MTTHLTTPGVLPQGIAPTGLFAGEIDTRPEDDVAAPLLMADSEGKSLPLQLKAAQAAAADDGAEPSGVGPLTSIRLQPQ